MAGYSSTPLERKLGLVSASGTAPPRTAVVHPPDDYERLLPDHAPERDGTGEVEWLHAFFVDAAAMEAEFPGLRDRITTAGQLWISWPKKASGVATTLTENIVREIGLAAGLVDVKVAAVDETWSGLKFVRRLADR
ncbi:hypothetical protein M6D93_13455 [Jatrophihabitans telluris]|uniref:DUF3052 domain-containing protein n=1 Tax=Jatrophihabitans telluris TaxID=2038343 RepID=A0ABY4QUH4_9ACTN|nr:hypothetical protein [Jatrophihabitans telluris]UQX87303.1 hypothetical protein M6D93_13455 [Jatrophihabitans telluris]